MVVEYFNLISIYEQISWLWDILFLGTILGTVFGTGGKKVKLFGEKTAQMPNVLGYIFAVATVYWLQKQNMTLFSLAPSLMPIFLILAGIAIWLWLDEMMGSKYNKLWPVVIAVFLTSLITGIFLPVLGGNFLGVDIPDFIFGLTRIIQTLGFMTLLGFAVWAVFALLGPLLSAGLTQLGGGSNWGGRRRQRRYEHGFTDLEKKLHDGFEHTKEYISQQLEPIKTALSDLKEQIKNVVNFIDGVRQQLRTVEEHQGNILRNLHTVAQNVSRTGELTSSLANDVGAMKNSYEELEPWLKSHTIEIIRQISEVEEEIQQVNNRSNQLHKEQDELIKEFQNADTKIEGIEQKLTNYIENPTLKAQLETLQQDIHSNFEALNANLTALASAERETKETLDSLKRKQPSVRRDTVKRVVDEALKNLKVSEKSLKEVQTSAGQPKERTSNMINQAQGNVLAFQHSLGNISRSLHEISIDLQASQRNESDATRALDEMANKISEVERLLQQINAKISRFDETYEKAKEAQTAEHATVRNAVEAAIVGLEREEILIKKGFSVNQITAKLIGQLDKGKDKKSAVVNAIAALASFVREFKPEILTKPVINDKQKRYLEGGEQTRVVLKAIESYEASKIEYFNEFDGEIRKLISELKDALDAKGPTQWKQKVLPRVEQYLTHFNLLSGYEEMAKDILRRLKAL